jgi:two-component sensor histidine kinase/CHASE3 domain sensor protein
MRARLFFGISIFLLLGSLLSLVVTLRDIGRSSSLVVHCYRVMDTTDHLYSMLKDTETGQRGLRPTGRSHILAPFINTIPQIRSRLAELRSLVGDGAGNKDRPQIAALITASYAEVLATLEQQARTKRGAEAHEAAMTNGGGATMNRVRVAKDSLDQEEQARLDKGTRSLEAAQQRALIIIYATAFAVAGTALLAAFLFFRRGRQTEKVLAGALENVVEGRSALSERERQLTAALSHEKVVVRELHHRVKNNLQMMTSFLQIRARAQGGEIGGELEGLAVRMRALALVQAHIYRTDTFDHVDFAGTLAEIAEQIVASHGGDNVTLIRDLDGPLELNVSRAVPLGLICCEIMMNAMNHAWPEGQRGTLRVSLRTKSTPLEIEIRDDGAGFVPDDAGHGLGTILLRRLTGEAGAAVSIDSSPGAGTTATVRFTRAVRISEQAA